MDNPIVQGIALVSTAVLLLMYLKRRRSRKAAE